MPLNSSGIFFGLIILIECAFPYIVKFRLSQHYICHCLWIWDNYVMNQSVKCTDRICCRAEISQFYKKLNQKMVSKNRISIFHFYHYI